MSIVDQTLMQLGHAQAEQSGQGVRRLPGFEDFPLPLKRQKAIPWRTGVIAFSLFVLGGAITLYYLPGEVPVPVPALVSQDNVEKVREPAAPPPADEEVAVPSSAAELEFEPLPTPPAASGVNPESASLIAAIKVWWQEGWSNLKARNADDALNSWAQGLRSLPENQRIVVGFAYTLQDRHLAFRQAEAIPGGFVVRVADVPQGGPRFRVVAVPMEVPASEVSQEMAARGHVVYETNARYLKERLYRAPVAQVSVPTAISQVELAGRQAAVIPPLAVATQRQEQLPVSAPASAPAPVRLAQKDAEELIAAARGALRSGQYSVAVSRAREITSEHPEQWEGWFVLGSAELASGNLPAADQALERASRLNHRSAAVVTQRALVAQERRDHGQAVRLLEEAKQLSPRLPEIHLNLGLSQEALGNTAAAEASYQSFLRLTDKSSVSGAYSAQRGYVMEKLRQQPSR